MAEEEDNLGALGGMPSKSGVKKEYENFSAKIAKVADRFLAGTRRCCGR